MDSLTQLVREQNRLLVALQHLGELTAHAIEVDQQHQLLAIAAEQQVKIDALQQVRAAISRMPRPTPTERHCVAGMVQENDEMLRRIMEQQQRNTDALSRQSAATIGHFDGRHCHVAAAAKGNVDEESTICMEA